MSIGSARAVCGLLGASGSGGSDAWAVPTAAACPCSGHARRGALAPGDGVSASVLLAVLAGAAEGWVTATGFGHTGRFLLLCACMFAGVNWRAGGCPVGVWVGLFRCGLCDLGSGLAVLGFRIPSLQHIMGQSLQQGCLTCKLFLKYMRFIRIQVTGQGMANGGNK